MLQTVNGLPVIVVNLEGLGKRPVNEEEFALLEKEGKLENLGVVDKTTLDTSHVINFPVDRFDKNVAFGDTFAIIEWIKRKKGLLVGCDTAMACASAMIKKDSDVKDSSVFIVLNKQADFRWGADTTSPRDWHHSKDVRVFQAENQGEWNIPLAQIRQEIEKRIKNRS
jgi:hypothetical protein